VLLVRYRRRSREEIETPWWAVGLVVAGHAAAGGCWGLASVWLAPSDELHRLFLAFVTAGMCAGSVTVSSSHLPSVVAFVLSATVPLAIFFAMQPFPVHGAMVVMTVFFAASVLLAALRSYRYFGDTVRLRFELAERTQALDAANTLLRDEIEHHHSTEAALRQAQKMDAIGRLTAGIAHDFNNLLMAIIGSVELLLKRVGLGAEESAQLATIRQAAGRGARLTRQLLAFARKQALRPQAVDLNDVVRDTAELLLSTLGEKVRIRLSLAPDLATAFIDPNQIEHAILNLAINSRDAMPDGGTLTMTTANVVMPAPRRPEDPPAGPCVQLAIADTGTGMTAEVLAKAFDPFFTTKEPGKGSGLGLSQVYGLIQQSGGTTRIESAVGRGTTVTLYLPLAKAGAGEIPRRAPAIPAPEARKQTAGVDGPPRRRARILLLDDDPMVRFATAGLLRDAGHPVVAAESAQEALQLLRDEADIGLFVVDFAMPDMSGDEVVREAHLTRPALPVLFITGYADVAALQDRLTLQKPFSGEELLQTVAQALNDDQTSARQSA
jgi:signal transduction histidine kinase